MKRIVLENLRSAYNVGNIVRTADALGWGVIRVGYTARRDHKQVQKTALGAQDTIPKMEFETIADFLQYTEQVQGLVIAAEVTTTSIPLDKLSPIDDTIGDVFVVVGNEVTGVEHETLNAIPLIIHIPMLGAKESLNVGQAAAIMMRQINHVLF